MNNRITTTKFDWPDTITNYEQLKSLDWRTQLSLYWRGPTNLKQSLLGSSAYFENDEEVLSCTHLNCFFYRHLYCFTSVTATFLMTWMWCCYRKNRKIITSHSFMISNATIISRHVIGDPTFKVWRIGYNNNCTTYTLLFESNSHKYCIKNL